jgi:hypothetical protein
MTTVREIESAIEKLPRDKLADFRRWFEEYDAAQWDKEFEDDAKSGKLDKLAEKAFNDLEKGKCREI